MASQHEEAVQAYKKLAEALRKLNQAIEHEQLGEIRKVWIPFNTALMQIISQFWLAGAKQADQLDFIERLVKLEDISEHQHDHLHAAEQALNRSLEDAPSRC